MPDTAQQPLSPDRTRPAAELLDAGARWPSPDDDLALGCECANPMLQIERWGPEVLAAPATQR